MAIALTENAIYTICTSKDGKTTDFNPVLQIIDLRRVNTQNPSSTERFRLVLSDGTFHQQGMLATQLNDLVKSGRLQKGSIVQLTEFTCGNVQNRLIIIVVTLNLILELGDLIGEPKQFSLNTDAQAPPQASFSAPVQPSMNQSGAATDNPRLVGGGPLGGNSFAGSAPRPTLSGGIPIRPSEIDHGMGSHSYGNSARYPDMGRNNPVHAPSMYPKIESSAGVAGPPGNIGLRPVQQPYQQQSPRYNRGPVAKNDGPSRINPIAALNPYQGSWTIKARVTKKAELKLYNNAKGEGKVFSFDLLDSSAGEIRVTCFNAVADQFYDLIEVGNVYLISRGALKPAQKNFNHLRNEYEITLDNNSTVQRCFEDDGLIPKYQFHFRPISEIEGMDNKSVVDVIGIVCSISPPSSIMTKRGIETQKRVLHLKDISGRSVDVTLWGNFCHVEGQRLQTLCDSGVHPVLGLKSCSVNEYNGGKSLGTIGTTTQLFIQPDFPEAQRMKGWYENEGKNTPSVPISRDMMTMARTDVRKYVSQIKDERLGTSEKPDYIFVSATIIYIKPENFCYTACPNVSGDRQCSKKVVNNGDGTWRCDKCDQTMGECDYRYILQFQIQDHTGSTWVTAFQECGEEIMGVPAKDLYDMKYESHDDDKFAEILRNALFNKYIFKLRVKEEMFSDEQRVKSTVQKVDKVNFSSETRFLLDLVDKLKNGDPSSLAPKQEFPISNTGKSSAGSGYFREPAPPVGNYMGSMITGSQQFGVPANQTGPYASQFDGTVLATTGYSGVSINCSGCGGSGHTAANCPNVAAAQGHSYEGGFNSRVTSGGGGMSSSSECYKCHQVGHWARDCPGVSVPQASSGGGGGGSSTQCYKCQQVGHWARDCPGVGSVPQASSGGVGGGGSSGECYKCHQVGHWARDCPGVSSVPRAYGSGNAAVGRYTSGPNQSVGGF